MNFSDITRIAEILQLNEQQRLALSSLLAGGGKSGPGAETIPGAAKAAVNVRLTEGFSLRDDAKNKQERMQSGDPTGELLASLTPELRKILLAAEPKMLEWIRASESNAARFMTDPIGAMREAVPDLDSGAIEKLAAIRAARARMNKNVPGLELVSIRLHADPPAESKERAR